MAANDDEFVIEDWLTVAEAAAVLRRSTRQTHRLAKEKGKIRTRKVSYCSMFYRPDVERLAVEMRSASAPQPGRQLMVPAELLEQAQRKNEALIEERGSSRILIEQLRQENAALKAALQQKFLSDRKPDQ